MAEFSFLNGKMIAIDIYIRSTSWIMSVWCNDSTEAELTAFHWFGLWDGLHGQNSPISHLHEWQLLPSFLPAHQQWVRLFFFFFFPSTQPSFIILHISQFFKPINRALVRSLTVKNFRRESWVIFALFSQVAKCFLAQITSSANHVSSSG